MSRSRNKAKEDMINMFIKEKQYDLAFERLLQAIKQNPELTTALQYNFYRFYIEPELVECGYVEKEESHFTKHINLQNKNDDNY